MLCTTTLLTSRSSTEISSWLRGSSDHSVPGNDRKLGPVTQRCSLANLCPFKARDASSAGLRLFSSCRQLRGKVSPHFVCTSARLYCLTSRIYYRAPSGMLFNTAILLLINLARLKPPWAHAWRTLPFLLKKGSHQRRNVSLNTCGLSANSCFRVISCLL